MLSKQCGHTCANVNGGAHLTPALPCNGVDCEVIVSPTYCVREITGVLLSQTLLDLSLGTENHKVCYKYFTDSGCYFL